MSILLLSFKILFSLVGAVLFVVSLIWVYADAEARGKNGALVALLVAVVAWPFSLVAWFVFRPPLPGEGAPDNRPDGFDDEEE